MSAEIQAALHALKRTGPSTNFAHLISLLRAAPENVLAEKIWHPVGGVRRRLGRYDMLDIFCDLFYTLEAESADEGVGKTFPIEEALSVLDVFRSKEMDVCRRDSFKFFLVHYLLHDVRPNYEHWYNIAPNPRWKRHLERIAAYCPVPRQTWINVAIHCILEYVTPHDAGRFGQRNSFSRVKPLFTQLLRLALPIDRQDFEHLLHKKFFSAPGYDDDKDYLWRHYPEAASVVDSKIHLKEITARRYVLKKLAEREFLRRAEERTGVPHSTVGQYTMRPEGNFAKLQLFKAMHSIDGDIPKSMMPQYIQFLKQGKTNAEKKTLNKYY